MFVALSCSRCHRVFRPVPADPRRLCPDCGRLVLEPRPSTSSGGVRSPRRYDGATRDLVRAMKFSGRRSVASALAAELAASIRADRSLDGGFDVVTWAPTSDVRRRRRGFDQAELIAKLVARHLGLPCRRLLVRAAGPAQTGRARHERLDGPRFRARPPRRASRVLVIDDVVTTGSTLRAAAHALDAAGWTEVVTAACAATPSVPRVGG